MCSPPTISKKIKSKQNHTFIIPRNAELKQLALKKEKKSE